MRKLSADQESEEAFAGAKIVTGSVVNTVVDPVPDAEKWNRWLVPPAIVTRMLAVIVHAPPNTIGSSVSIIWLTPALLKELNVNGPYVPAAVSGRLYSFDWHTVSVSSAIPSRPTPASTCNRNSECERSFASFAISGVARSRRIALPAS